MFISQRALVLKAVLVSLPALKAHECTLTTVIQEDFKVKVIRKSDATENEVTKHIKLTDERKKQLKEFQFSYSIFQNAASTRCF